MQFVGGLFRGRHCFRGWQAEYLRGTIKRAPGVGTPKPLMSSSLVYIGRFAQLGFHMEYNTQ